MSNKTEILKALTGNISYMKLQSKLKIMLSRKCFLKMLPAKWPLFCSGLNVWKYVSICFVCRVAIQENIDIIKLQREVKEKSTKLTALQGQYANLEEVSVHWLNSLRPGPIFCLLLGVSSGCAQPITGQVTSVPCWCTYASITVSSLLLALVHDQVELSWHLQIVTHKSSVYPATGVYYK